jgi:undecaprenyl-diphosphatase
MTFIASLILGLVEGVTEFLPISSTAHMEIASRLLHLAQSDFLKTFEIVIQFGAILAVVILYFSILKRNVAIWKRIIVAFIPTGIIGFLLYKVIKHYFLDNFNLTIWAIGIGGIILIVFEYFYHEGYSENSMLEIEQLPYGKAFTIGLAQALAVVPGVSRSAATIVAGRMLGMSRKAIVEFSFLLAVPTMLAASGYELLKSHQGITSSGYGFIVLGFIAAFIAAWFSVKTFIRFIERHGFTWFGYYRIILALVLAFFWF